MYFCPFVADIVALFDIVFVDHPLKHRRFGGSFVKVASLYYHADDLMVSYKGVRWRWR